MTVQVDSNAAALSPEVDGEDGAATTTTHPREADLATLHIVPANEAACGDLVVIFGERGDAAGCQCQWFKLPRGGLHATPRSELAARLHQQTACGHADAPGTTGLVAYLGDEPVGWCAVEPRVNYMRLRTARVPWTGRDEDKGDTGVWAITCFVTRAGYRGRGVSRALARAAVAFARERGARAIEGYAVERQAGKRYPASSLFVGTRKVFEGAGFREVSHPTPARVVMRLELGGQAGA